MDLEIKDIDLKIGNEYVLHWSDTSTEGYGEREIKAIYDGQKKIAGNVLLKFSEKVVEKVYDKNAKKFICVEKGVHHLLVNPEAVTLEYISWMEEKKD